MTGRQELRPLAAWRRASVTTTVVVLGGPYNTLRSLRNAAEDCAARYTLDGAPFLGVSLRAVLPNTTLRDVLVARFSRFPKIYAPAVRDITEAGFRLWPTFRSPDHYDVQLHSTTDDDLAALLAAFGAEMANPAWLPG